MLTLHPQINLLHEEFETLGPFVIRGMDGDISQDHFLNNSLGDKETDFQKILKQLVDGKFSLISGGYRWNVEDVEKKARSFSLAKPKIDSDVIKKLKSLLEI